MQKQAKVLKSCSSGSVAGFASHSTLLQGLGKGRRGAGVEGGAGIGLLVATAANVNRMRSVLALARCMLLGH